MLGKICLCKEEQREMEHNSVPRSGDSQPELWGFGGKYAHSWPVIRGFVEAGASWKCFKHKWVRMREGFQADTGKSLEAGMDMACVLWPSVEELALRSSGTRG